MSMITEEIRRKATEIYHGNEECKAQAQRLLREVGLPNGLLPLQDVEECGYVEETGFVWLKQKKEIKHKFEKIGKLASYATEVTAHIKPCKIKKLTGVKAKELLLWITLSEITVDSPTSEKIVLRTPTGLFMTLPTDAFVMVEAAKETVAEKAANKKEEVEAKKEVKVEAVATTTNTATTAATTVITVTATAVGNSVGVANGVVKEV